MSTQSENMDIHEIVMYIRDSNHTVEECERLLWGLQKHIAEYVRKRIEETYGIEF